MTDNRRQRPDDEDDDDYDAIRRRARQMLKDKELTEEFSTVVHGHFWTLTWRLISGTVAKWLLVAIGSGIAVRILAYGVQEGWFK